MTLTHGNVEIPSISTQLNVHVTENKCLRKYSDFLLFSEYSVQSFNSRRKKIIFFELCNIQNEEMIHLFVNAGVDRWRNHLIEFYRSELFRSNAIYCARSFASCFAKKSCLHFKWLFVSCVRRLNYIFIQFTDGLLKYK